MKLTRFSLMGVAAGLLGGAWWAPDPGAQPRRVAVTVDDLPLQHLNMANGESEGRRLSGLLLETFRRYRIPAAGFVAERRGTGEMTREVLRMWLRAGMDLGNHTYSHLDGNRVPLAEYTADIVRGEEALRETAGTGGLRFFRHPFLHTGATEETRRGMAAFLEGRGYRTAPVTFDNQEWVFAAAYEGAAAKGRRAEMARIASAYVEYMDENFAFFERRSREVLGREPAQVLLIHMNRLNAEHFGRVAARLVKRGYAFVSLEAAMADETYRIEDRYAGTKGLSWIHRWGLTLGKPLVEEPREPEWVAKLMTGD